MLGCTHTDLYSYQQQSKVTRLLSSHSSYVKKEPETSEVIISKSSLANTGRNATIPPKSEQLKDNEFRMSAGNIYTSPSYEKANTNYRPVSSDSLGSSYCAVEQAEDDTPSNSEDPVPE